MNNLILTTFVHLDFKVLHLHNLKYLRGFHSTLHSNNLTFTTSVQHDFLVLHLYNLEPLSTISLYTAVTNPEFYYILVVSFHVCALTQPEIFFFFGKWHISLHPQIVLPSHSCYVCMFTYTSPYFVHLFMLKLSYCRKEAHNLFALAYIPFAPIIKKF